MYEKDKSMTKEEEVFEAFRHCISDPGCGKCPRKSEDCSKGIGHFEYVEKRLSLDVVEMLKEHLGIIHCRDCKYFKVNDHWGDWNGMPVLATSNCPTCYKWGDGCMTSPDGYCYLAERLVIDDG